MHVLPTRNDLGKLLKPGAICVEAGVWRGYYSTEILKWPNVAKLFLVDAWTPLGLAYKDPLSETDHEENLRLTKHHVRGHMAGGRVQIVRGMSQDVAKNDRTIPPLDFCFIDAAHDFESVLADLRAWAPRMKPDAVLAGHDWTDNSMSQQYGWGVKRAVAEFCAETDWRMTHVTDEDFASFVLQRQ
jgi:hypothetical protein